MAVILNASNRSSLCCQPSRDLDFHNLRFYESKKVNTVGKGIYDILEMKFLTAKGKEMVFYSFSRQTSMNCIQKGTMGCCFCCGREYDIKLIPVFKNGQFDANSQVHRDVISAIAELLKSDASTKIDLAKNNVSLPYFAGLFNQTLEWELIFWNGEAYAIRSVRPCCVYVRLHSISLEQCPCVER